LYGLPGGELPAGGVDIGATIAAHRCIHAELFEAIAKLVHA
jgi:hypothetical protein